MCGGTISAKSAEKMKKEISVTVRYLIGVRWDGRETKLSTKETGARLDNPAQYCIDRQWVRIEGVALDWARFEVYKNPYPIILGYGSRPAPDPGPTPEWELDRRKKQAEYKPAPTPVYEDDYF